MNDFRFRPTLLLATVLLLVLVVGACRGQSGPTPEPTATATPSPAPKPTAMPSPTPEPTATPSPTPTPDVTAGFTEFESREGAFSLRYPGDWFTRKLFGFTIFASNQELLDSPDAGEEGGVVLVVTTDTAEFESSDPVEALNEAIAKFAIGEDTEVTEGPEPATINGQDAAVARVSATSDTGMPLSAYVALIMSGERAAVLIAATPAATEAEFVPIFEAIAASIEVSAATAPATPEASLPETEGFLLYGDSVAGSVTEDGASAWEFIGLEGEVVHIIIEPFDELDVMVNVLNESGASILENGEVDESFGIEEIRDLTIPAAGTFTITVAGFGSSVGEYELMLTEANSTAGGENGIAYGDSVTGAIAAANEMATWRFTGTAGDIVAISVAPVGDFDAVLDLQDSTRGSILVGDERDYSYGDEHAIVALPADGEYSILVKGFEGSTGDYELRVTGPAGSVLSASDTLEEGDNGEGHAFPFTASAGEVVGIVVEPEGDLDVVVEIRDGDGEMVRTEPFDASFGTESFAFSVPEDGNYSFRVKGFEDALGSYDVRLLGSDTTIFELAYNDVVNGRIGADSFVEYVISGLAGDTMAVEVESEDAVDVVAQILDLDDNMLAEVDNATTGGTESLTYIFEEEALVVIRVSDFFGNPGNFALMVTATTGS